MNHLTKIKSKIYTWSNLEEQVVDWKKNGEKIVFTNGCFDILHLGHVDYLSKAADLGTKFIIGVNTDASVSRIKGPTRPIVHELSRTTLLAALGFVDAVVLFDQPTPFELISLVTPHVLVKGADYEKEKIVGYDVVTAAGGTVETIPFLDGFSTTNIVHKIKTS